MKSVLIEGWLPGHDRDGTDISMRQRKAIDRMNPRSAAGAARTLAVVVHLLMATGSVMQPASAETPPTPSPPLMKEEERLPYLHKLKAFLEADPLDIAEFKRQFDVKLAQSAEIVTSNTTYTVFDTAGSPQPARRAFEPAADGKPLPPKNSAAARYWPPAFKNFLDQSLAIFLRGGKEPSIVDIEDLLKIRLVPVFRPSRVDSILHEYIVQDWPLHTKPTHGEKQQLVVLRSASANFNSWQIKVFLDAEFYCVNPYEIAIYLGEEFFEDDTRMHVEKRDAWPFSYTWGMFKRGSQGEHVSRSVQFTTPRQESGKPHIDPGCIGSIALNGRFNKE